MSLQQESKAVHGVDLFLFTLKIEIKYFIYYWDIKRDGFESTKTRLALHSVNDAISYWEILSFSSSSHSDDELVMSNTFFHFTAPHYLKRLKIEQQKHS